MELPEDAEVEEGVEQLPEDAEVEKGAVELPEDAEVEGGAVELLEVVEATQVFGLAFGSSDCSPGLDSAFSLG